MIALNGAVADAPRTPRTRSPRKTGDQSPKGAPARLAKSRDAGKTKVSFYLDASVAAKLAVSAIIRQSDQSDVANEILGRALSAVTYYDRSTRPSDQALPAGEDRPDVAA
jgi:hypothetical protein